MISLFVSELSPTTYLTSMSTPPTSFSLFYNIVFSKLFIIIHYIYFFYLHIIYYGLYTIFFLILQGFPFCFNLFLFHAMVIEYEYVRFIFKKLFTDETHRVSLVRWFMRPSIRGSKKLRATKTCFCGKVVIEYEYVRFIFKKLRKVKTVRFRAAVVYALHQEGIKLLTDETHRVSLVRCFRVPLPGT